MKQWLAFAFVLLIVKAPWAQACSTPVYRYAMYNWLPEPYYVFYLHQGEPAKADEALHRKITELSDAMPPVANVLLEPIDLAERPAEKLPEPLRKAWEAQEDKSQPRHVVVSPWGVELFSGRLDAATVDAMLDSPLRTRMAEMLDGGQVAVLVLLAGADEAENQRAEKVVGEVIARAASGELLPDLGLPLEGADEEQDAEDRGLELGLLKLSRTDPAEQWLVRLLTSIEPDLNEKPLVDQPMLFAVYGRGRAMPPYVGKGITPENLTDLVMFLSGACSCVVKDANPGMDLLVHWDWEATAERMAANEFSLDQFSSGYAEFAVEMPEDPAVEEVPEAPEPIAAAEGESQAPPSDAKPADQGAKSGDTETTEAATPEPPPPSSEARDAVAHGTVSEEAADLSSTSRAMWRVGIGVGVVAAAVLAAGLVLILKRNG